MSELRWGILGYAGIARKKIIPALTEARNAAPYAIASRSVDKLDEAARCFGFTKLYESYDSLLNDPDVDVVYIPLPNALHKEWVIRALQAGKHVLCEKPLAQTAEDCREMLETANEKGLLLGEAFMYRFSSRARMVRDLLDSGAIGKVVAIHASHRFLLSDPSNVRVNAALGGGSIWDVGCYPINFIGMVLDDEPVSVKAEKIDFQGVDSAIAAVLRYDNGVICTISSGFNGQCALLAEINGTEGCMIVTETYSDMDKTDPAPIQIIRNGKVERIPVQPFHTYTMEIEAFSRSVLTGEPLVYDAAEAIRNTSVIQRILEAAE